MTWQTLEPLEHHNLGIVNKLAEFYIAEADSGSLTLDPPYQRGDVWTDDQRIALVRSWMQGVPIGAVIINDRTGRDGEWFTDTDATLWAVIDGKQRVTTALRWFAGELAVPASWFRPIFLESTTATADGPYTTYPMLTKVGRRWCRNHFLLPTCEVFLRTVEEEAAIYQLVNGGGTPHTAGDLDKAARVASGA